MRRVKEALTYSDDRGFVRDSVVPFLEALGSDALARGTCKESLGALLECMCRIPGFLGALKDTLLFLPDPAPVAWFFLNVALTVEGARRDPHVRQAAEAMQGLTGAAAQAAKQLQNLLASGSSAAPSATAVSPLEHLQSQAGGRHDNDHSDFRSIAIMPTSQEVSYTL